MLTLRKIREGVIETFRSIFISIVIGTALIVAAVLFHKHNPNRQQPTAELVRASGKCASCHRRETAAVVHQFELGVHAQRGVNCLDCHRPVENQEAHEHRGFTITLTLTAKNCAQCHPGEYQQYLRSRHAAPAWAAVYGAKDFTAEQIAAAESYHKGAVDRPANALAALEGRAATINGCVGCHGIGRPNADGSIGQCTDCHSNHNPSVALAREPNSCGQCHLGPDHAQFEIYSQSKHGTMFHLQRHTMNMGVRSEHLTAKDMPVPTCATCHMGGIDGLGMTHDTTERLSYFLFAPISAKRPTYMQGRNAMQEVCKKCHASARVEKLYEQAEAMVAATNERVQAGKDLMLSLRKEGLLTPEPFDEVFEFHYFDFWHHYGRTAKHGAFMMGADYVQWHGNYELLKKMIEMQEIAEDLRARKKH